MTRPKTRHLRDGVAHFNPINPIVTVQVADTIAARLLPGDVLLQRTDLKRLGIPYSNAHLLRLEAQGLFPRRVRLSPGKSGKIAWIDREVLDWLNTRAAARATDSYADCAD
jgi:predicted DNA-binding transcriptional regulator AlpA